MPEKWVLTWIEPGASEGFIGHAMTDTPADTPSGRKLVAMLDVFGCADRDEARGELERRVEAMGGVLEEADRE